MPDPLDPVEALRQIADDYRTNGAWTICFHCGELEGTPHAEGCAGAIAAAALAALPAPEPTLTGEETVNWYGLLRSAAAILPEVETPERLLVAARNLAHDIDAVIAPYPTSFDLPAAAPEPEGVPEDHRVCSHGIYHHGCLSCDRQDPEERL